MCPSCNGTGALPLPGGPVICPACGGTGVDVTTDQRVPIYPEPV